MKNDNLKRNDASPPVLSGDFVAVQSVVAITNLSVTGPYRGDFQIIDQGRLIVGEDPDIGPRGILAAKALQGFNSNGINTFAVWFATVEGHAPGDFHAGNLSGNYLGYNQADGTLGLYTPDGAGVIMDNDGTFIAGHQDHGHMKWDAVSQSLKIMSGAEVMAEFGDAGSATFQGIVTATGGRIIGRMVIDDVLQVGDVDGPAVYVGRFQRTTSLGATVETSEIMATDSSNLPWFHVVAGGETLPGFFHLGGTGDYDQKLEYDGTTLRLDGTIIAQAGTFAGTVTIGPTGAIVWGNGKGRADDTGILIRAYDLNAGPDQTRNYLRFVTSGNETLSWLGGYYTTTANSVFMLTDSRGKARNATTAVQAFADAGKAVEANIAAAQGSTETYVAARISAAAATTVAVKADTTKIGDGGTSNYVSISSTGVQGFAGTARIAPKFTVRTITDSDTAAATDAVIVCNKGSAMTVTLPAATGDGTWYTIKNIGAGTVTVDGNGAETIDGAATQALAQWGKMQIVSYASGAWVII